MPATPPPDTGPPTRVVSTAAASNATATPSPGAPTRRLGLALAVIATAQLMVVLEGTVRVQVQQFPQLRHTTDPPSRGQRRVCLIRYALGASWDVAGSAATLRGVDRTWRRSCLTRRVALPAVPAQHSRGLPADEIPLKIPLFVARLF